MKIELTRKEIGAIRVALNLAVEYEESLIEAYDNVEWEKNPVKNCKQNIKEFKKIYEKLKY